MRTTIGNIGKRIIEILGMLLLMGITISYVYNCIGSGNVDTGNLVVVCILLLFMLVAYGIAHLIQHKKVCIGIWVILVVAIPRICTIMYTGDIFPISDSKMYYELAKTFVENGITTIQDIGISEYITMFPYIVWYPIVLAPFLKCIGFTITHIQWINLLFSIGTGWMLYQLVKIRTGNNIKFASIAVLLWACNPSQFLYAPLMYTEHVFLLFVVALLYVYSHYEKKETISKKQICLYGIGMGLCAFGAYQTRVAGLIVWIAILIYEGIRILIQKRHIQQTLCIFAISIGIILIGNQLYQSLILQRIVLPEHKQQSSLFSYTFYVGANTNYKGVWNQQDASEILDRAREVGVTQANKEYLDKLLHERYPMDLWEYIVLQTKKFIIFHNPAHGSIEYLKAYEEEVTFQDMTLATYLFETVMIILLGVKLIKKKQFTSYSSVLLLIFIGNTLFNMLVETSGRYSAVEAIILCVLLIEQWNEDNLKLPCKSDEKTFADTTQT